jgi:hypothetical protein
LPGELAAAKDAAVLDAKIGERSEKLPGGARGTGGKPAGRSDRAPHPSHDDAEAWYALFIALAVEAAGMSVLLIAETTPFREENYRG